MKTAVMFCVLFILAENIFAQKEQYDILTFTAPKGWKKNTEETLISYTTTDAKKNTWCRINIVKSTVSKGSIEKDFENEWQDLVVKNYTPSEKSRESDIQEAEGWKIKAGSSKFIFDGKEAMAMLTTASGYNRCISIVAVTNNKDYVKDVQALIASVDLTKPETASTINKNKISLLGTWCITASDQSDFRVRNGIMSTISRQYTFKQNGSYTCNIKTFDPMMISILLGRETGTYQNNENTLIINPQKSVLEEWSKKNNADQWGKLLKTQKINFEKTTYTFDKIYIAEINEWQLILKAANQTKRDGPFNNYEKNAWVYIATSPARPVIKLPGE